jgi:hypothetical protein
VEANCCINSLSICAFNIVVASQDLHTFGFRNNLTRVSQRKGPAGGAPDAPARPMEDVGLQKLDIICLATPALYVQGLISSDEVAKAILRRMLSGWEASDNLKYSQFLITNVSACRLACFCVVYL